MLNAGHVEMVENTTAETDFLYSARNGDAEHVSQLLEQKAKNLISFDINCTGKNKANRGWTAAHLASYFGHLDVVKVLLKNNADFNVSNDVGDSPLHKAAFSGRQEIVTLLLQNGVDVNVVNAEGYSASQLARTGDIRQLIDAAVKTDQRLREESFMKICRDGDHEALTEMLNTCRVLNINCVDTFGNTALHWAAIRGRKSVVIVLLQAGINTSLRNARGQTAYDIASDTQMKQLLDVKANQTIKQEIHRHEGLLFRKVRLIGWRPSWVVLERGVLSVFSSRADSTTGSNRKWYKYLDGAVVLTRPDAPQLLPIKFSDNKIITFSAGRDPNSLITCKKWENAISEHISYSSRFNGRVIDDDKEYEEFVPLASLQDMLKTAQAHQQVLEEKLNATVAELDNQQQQSNNSSDPNKQLKQHTDHVLRFHQQVSDIIDSSKNMSLALTNCLTLFVQQEQIRRVELEQEREKSRILQESLRVLAQEHLQLERSLSFRPPSVLSSTAHPQGTSTQSIVAGSEIDEFYDCESDDSLSEMASVSNTNDDFVNNGDQVDFAVASFNEVQVYDERAELTSKNSCDLLQDGNLGTSVWGGRCRLPVQMFDRNFSVWAILKQCIGKELSRITMPVIFNEPLSFLQRMAEYTEYSELLKKAAECDDVIQRHELVTAFAVSATASNWERIGKPFNPLLGETYEFDRYDDLGYRMVCEQVSHHPPVSAFHVESPDYSFHGSIEPKLRFWGKSVEVTPKGYVTLYLNRYNEAYSWQYTNCCVHNIIVGKIWIEHYGALEVVNNKTKNKSVINFKTSGWFGKDIHKTEGFLYDKNKRKLRAYYGKWTDALFGCDVKSYEDTLSRPTSVPDGSTSAESAARKELTSVGSNTSLSTTASREEDIACNGSSTPTNLASTSMTTKDGSVRSSAASCSDLVTFDNAAGEYGETETDDIQDIVSSERLVDDLRVPGQVLLWKASSKPTDSDKYYNFTLFAMMLNELNDTMRRRLPPTDSRLRPDIKNMEHGNIDLAAAEKNRLEEKQRAARKSRGGDKTWKPRWFRFGRNPYTQRDDWIFTGEYWTTQDFSNCPDIY